MNQIKVSDLYKIYGKDSNKITALNGVSFALFFNELTVILGPSGSGKSTLLNILGGMDSPTSGSVLVSNRDITRLKDKELTLYRRNDIGFVFQFYNLMPNLTALENVRLCQNAAAKRNGADNKGILTAEKALELVGLSHRQGNFPAQLSGGEQQRVSIARAIVKNPRLLLCDEPTGALDTKTGRSIMVLLQKIARESNSAVVVVTHNNKLSLAANRILRLSDGNIVENSIKEKPLNAEDIEF